MPTSVASAVARISADDSRLQRTLGRASRSLDRFSRGGADGFDLVARAGLNLTGSLVKVGAAAGVAATAIAALTIREAAQEIGDFGAAISRVEGLTGLEETSEAFAALREEARNLGADTQFSATEAADGMAFLAQAGFDANQILESSGNFLNLAAAGSLELAEAMDIASNIMSGFGLPASDSARIADVLAKASASANTNVAQLGEAFKAAGPVAKLLNIEIEDAAAAIGVLGNVGIQGADAGTALRNVMLRLASGGSEVEKGLAAMNLTLSDVSPSANSVSDVFQKLIDSTRDAGLSADETASAFSKVFGVRATAAGASLSNLNVDIKDLAASLRDADGSAERMAETFVDNLPGDIKKFQSALAELYLTAGDSGFESSLRSSAQAATEFVRDLGRNEGLQRFIATLSSGLDNALESITSKLSSTDFDQAFEDLTATFNRLVGAAGTVSDFLGDIRDRLDFDGALNVTIRSVERLIEAFGGFEGETVDVARAIQTGTDYLVKFVEATAPLAKFMAENAVEIIGVAAAFKALSIASSAAAGIQAVSASVAAGARAFAAYRAQVVATNASLAANSAASKAAAASSGAQGAAAGAAYGSRFAGALRLAGPAIAAAVVGWQLGKYIDDQLNISGKLESEISRLLGLIDDSGESTARAFGRDIDLKGINDQLSAVERIADLSAVELEIRNKLGLVQLKASSASGEQLAALQNTERSLSLLVDRMDKFRALTSQAASEGKTLGEVLDGFRGIALEDIDVNKLFEPLNDAHVQLKAEIDSQEVEKKIFELENSHVLIKLDFDIAEAAAKVDDKIFELKTEASKILSDAEFNDVFQFDENTIKGLQGKLREVSEQRESSQIGSAEFDSLTDETNRLTEKLREMRDQVAGVNGAAGRAAAGLSEVSDEAERQRGIARGEDALRNRFDRLSAADRGDSDFESFKSEQEDPFSFLRKRGEEITDIADSDLLKRNVDRIRDAQAEEQKSVKPPTDNRDDFLERELNKLGDRQGPINEERRRARGEAAEEEARRAKKAADQKDKPKDDGGPMAKLTRIVKQIDLKAADIKQNTADQLQVLRDRLPTKSI